MMKLRYTGACIRCGTGVGQGERAWWDAEAKAVWCLPCREASGPVETPPREGTVPVAGNVVGLQSAVDVGLAVECDDPEPPTAVPLNRGTAGKSAREEYERRHRKHEERLEQKWGRLAGVAKLLADEPQSTRAWARGADGERRIAGHLELVVGDKAVFLHDRRVPGTKGNVDHLAVAASGVWIIDAKNYSGKVEHRDVGGWFKTDLRLYVGGRDRSKAADGLGWQVLAVSKALDDPDIPVHPALCFVEAEWGLFSKPFRHNGVWVGWANKLAEAIVAPGPMDSSQVESVAEKLAAGLPAK